VRTAVLLVALWPILGAAQTDPDPWFAPDKALHFSFSAGLAGLGYGGAALVTENRVLRLVAGGSIALAAGITKELLDLSGLGDPSWKDLAWDCAGIAVGLVFAWLIDRFVVTPLAQPAPKAHRSALTKGFGEVGDAAMVGSGWADPVGSRRLVAVAW
jgi:putative lipoprotein